MDKTALRRTISARKRSLTVEQIEDASRRLASLLFSHPIY